MEKLKEYRRKRDFRKTLEPAGADSAVEAGCLYVMHKHKASRDHFDLRLEQEGVLRSWALPKGPSMKPGEKRLAVEVEDHPLEYGGFEGVIPESEYGGGTVMLWDAGRWVLNGKHNADQIDFVLDGTKLQGAWTLVRTRGRNQRRAKSEWLLIKRSDKKRAKLKPDDTSVASGRTMQEIAKDRDNVWVKRQTQTVPLLEPANLEGAKPGSPSLPPSPELATATQVVPGGKGWLHEIKYDGYRLMAWLANGAVRLYTRNGKDWSRRFPDIVRALSEIPVDSALLDGEVAFTSKSGVTNFSHLQEALSTGKTSRLYYYCFDLLYLDGYDLTEAALRRRKEKLAEFLRAAGMGRDGHVLYSEHVDAKGQAFYEESCRLGLEGVISKRAEAPYRSGRGKQWLKTKCTYHREFVVGGYTQPGGARTGFGALLLGGFRRGRLCYAGRVGTGFNARQLKELHGVLRRLQRKTNPFDNEVPNTSDVTWVKPELVIEVEYSQRTSDGRLRHPAFRGVREDRDAEEIVLEDEPQEPVVGTSSDMSAAVRGGKVKVAGVTITHPERVVYPQQGATKLALAHYYEAVADWMLPALAGRPLALLRCPQGRSEQCFFQKHPGTTISESVPRVDIAEKDGYAAYVYVETMSDIINLVQMGTMEFHPWGCRIEDIEHPDTMVFDLDPSPGVGWNQIMETARSLRARLEDLGLQSFLRTTGGKGVHLVVPLMPKAGWDEMKEFSRAVSQCHADQDPSRLTTNPGKNKRRGKIFIDYLRNGRGSTAIASYSARARQGAPVAVPIKWSELDAALRPDQYTIDNLLRRLRALKRYPWEGFEKARKSITPKMRKAVGLDEK